MLQIGSALGDYTLLKKFAEGGMGEIYLGARLEPTGFAPPVVLKVLRDELSDDSTFVDMIVDEANIAMRLKHRNVVSVLDFGAESNTYYMAMEYVHGVSLDRLLEAHEERKVKLDLPVAFYIAMELCSALSYAHSRRDAAGNPIGLVHRDVTPANILLSSQGDVKLTDFGLARASGRNTETMPGVLKGRFGYMAPELLRYEAIDSRADVFSAGVVTYEMFSGKHPADGFSMVDALSVFQEKKWPPSSSHNPHVPEALDAILGYALDAQPGTRYQSADELGSAMRELVTHWARQWPEISNGRVRLASMMPTLFPELSEPPIRPAELEALLEIARMEEAAGVPDRPSQGWDEAADATMIRAIAPLSLPPMPLPSDAIQVMPVDAQATGVEPQVMPVDDGEDPPTELGMKAITPDMVREIGGGAYQELSLDQIKPSDSIDFDVDVSETMESPATLPPGGASVFAAAAALCKANLALTDGGSVNKAFDTAMDEIVAALSADRGFVIVPRGDDLDMRSARGSMRQPLLPHDRRVANGVVKGVLAEGVSRASLDAGADDWLAGRGSAGGLGARSALCVPIANRGVVLGVLYLDDLDTDREFDSDARQLCSAAAAAFALLLENDQLRQRIEQGRMEPTGDLPSGIRQGFVPDHSPKIEGWQIAAHWQFAQASSGDFHDWVETPESVRVVLAHVHDQEAPPGMFTAQARAYLRACIDGNTPLADAMRRANGLLHVDRRQASSMTTTVVDIGRTGDGGIAYVNAGQAPPLFYRTSHNRLFSLAETSGALGVDAEIEPSPKPVKLYSGDIIVMLTGGVVDAKGPGIAAFGWDRLQKIVLENRMATAKELVVALERALNLFIGASALERDLTVVVVKRS